MFIRSSEKSVAPVEGSWLKSPSAGGSLRVLFGRNVIEPIRDFMSFKQNLLKSSRKVSPTTASLSGESEKEKDSILGEENFSPNGFSREGFYTKNPPVTESEEEIGFSTLDEDQTHLEEAFQNNTGKFKTVHRKKNISVQELEAKIARLKAVIETTTNTVNNYPAMRMLRTTSSKTFPGHIRDLDSLKQSLASNQKNLKEAESKLAEKKLFTCRVHRDPEFPLKLFGHSSNEPFTNNQQARSSETLIAEPAPLVLPKKSLLESLLGTFKIGNY